MLLLASVACSPPGWEEVRSACELSGGESRQLAWHRVEVDPSGPPLSLECATTLGEAFQVDWDDLLTSADVARDPANPESALVGGLYTLVAADLGTVGELRAAADPQEVIVSDTAALALLATLDDDEPASRFYAEYFWGVVPRIGLTQDGGCLMETDALRGVQVCPIWYRDPGDWLSYSYARTNPSTASILVHESFHLASGDKGHIEGDCPYDADWSGPYGAGARWLYMWEASANGEVTSDDVEAASAGRNDACTAIEDHEGWAPCVGASPDLCDPDAGSTPISTG